MHRLSIDIIASSSKGNCIALDDGEGIVLLDVGIRFSKMIERIELHRLEGALVTHEHMDHCRSAGDLLFRGYDVFMSGGTQKVLFPAANSAEVVRSGQTFEIGEGWMAVGFDVEHDVEEPLGFVISSLRTGKKIVYAVDTPRINYSFSGITHWILECNFEEVLLAEGNYEEWLKNRVRHGHMSLYNLKEYLKDSDLSQSEAIYLVHLSTSNAHARRFVKEIQQATGVPCYTETSSRSRRPLPRSVAQS